MLVIFRYTSNQKEIKEAKDKIRAYLFEIRLFKDDLGIQLSAQKNILIHNLRYMKHALKPMLFMIIPVVIILIQLDGWFGYRPLKVGESAIVSVNFSDGQANALPEVSIQTDKGIIVETPPLRIPTQKEASWRVRANEIGEHDLRFNVSGSTFDKSIIVSDGQLKRVSRVVASGFWDNFLNPGEQPLAKNSLMKKIEINYPSRSIEIFGWGIHWLVAFFILSIVFGFAFKGLLKVEI
ncbi:MAG: hypothetical protein HYV59_01030 [Planctomycetes bacterium]|nr:hypothetical protein [Planctomycetota bacterium]